MKYRILHIIPHNQVFPPKGGGMLRCFHIMDQLGKIGPLDVISYQTKNEFNRFNYRNENINFYTNLDSVSKFDIFDVLPKKIKPGVKYRWLLRSMKGPAEQAVLDFYPVLKSLKRNNDYSAVVFEHSSSMKLAPIVRKFWPNAKLILNAHNVDYKLATTITDKNRFLNIESTLYKYVDEVWACSKLDTDTLLELNNNRINGVTIPNGVDTGLKPFDEDKKEKEKKIIFCGSLNYEPNKEGLTWFLKEVWPAISNAITGLEFTIIGRGDISPYIELTKDPNIHLLGEVDDVHSYYYSNNIAVVPLLSGSGTRLKILEAMSFGNPVITTRKGIEGIEALDSKHAIIAEGTEDFIEKLKILLNNGNLCELIRVNARKLMVSKYDWNKIGEDMAKYIKK